MRGLTLVQRQRKDMRRIAVMVAALHDITEADLYVRDRNPHFVKARVVFWKMLYKKGFTQETIASLAGWDHTTIGHALQSETSPQR